MYKLFRPLLFKLSKDPETVHNLALSFLKYGGFWPVTSALNSFTKVSDPSLKQKVFGLQFNNPLGLAGGFDKNGEAVKVLQALGFGFLEVGTVTRYPQSGNERPRLFRLSEDQALINRMGFNNRGADVLAKNLKNLNKRILPLGVNLGKSKITELSSAKNDYLYSLQSLYSYGDYFVVNISSPNTPGLRKLANKEFLVDIISTVTECRNKQKVYKPILLKVVVDFSLQAIDEALEICKTYKIDGVICSNTSISRNGLKNKINQVGGLSGRPIREISTELIKHIRMQASSLPIIGVGGIFSAEDAYEKIKAGAPLVQIYTGFIYEGPFIAKKINQGLVKLLKRDGFENVSEAVGVETK